MFLQMDTGEISRGTARASAFSWPATACCQQTASSTAECVHPLPPNREALTGNLQFADICKVDKRCFLGPYSYNLRRLHNKFSFFSSHHIRIFFPHDVEHSIEQLQNKGFTSTRTSCTSQRKYITPKAPETALTTNMRSSLPTSTSPYASNAHFKNMLLNTQ